MSISIPRRAMLAIVGLLLAATLATTASSASAWNYYAVHPRHSEKCLDVAGFSYVHGADVIQGNCWGGPNQQWAFVRIGPGDGYYEIHARHSGKCLDVANASNAHGANVLQADCRGTYNQQWYLIPTDSGYYRIVARHSNRCLDVANVSIAHGADVVQGTCWTPGFNQQWRLEYKATA